MAAVKGQLVMERDLSSFDQHRYRGKIAVVRYLYRILKRAVRRIEEIALVHKAPFVLTADIGHRPTKLINFCLRFFLIYKSFYILSVSIKY